MAQTKLAEGEQYLIQSVDKKLTLTNQRLIFRRLPWTSVGHASVNLEDIRSWEIKYTSKNLYIGISFALAVFIYFSKSFVLLSGFFLVLYFMTIRRRLHVKTATGNVVLPLEVDERLISNLIEMVRKAKHTRQEELQKEPMLA